MCIGCLISPCGAMDTRLRGYDEGVSVGGQIRRNDDERVCVIMF